MTREEAILVLDSLSTWIGCEIPITEEIVEAIKTLSKSPLPSDLDEATIDKAAEEYAFDNADNNSEYMNSYLGFKAGAEYDREQIMKDAVEGKIIFLLNGDVAINIGDTDEYELGKKVRVIVLPKED